MTKPQTKTEEPVFDTEYMKKIVKEYPPQRFPKRTVTISITRTPPISGYGGFDEWTLDDMTSDEIDTLLEGIEKLCQQIKGDCFTGSE